MATTFPSALALFLLLSAGAWGLQPSKTTTTAPLRCGGLYDLSEISGISHRQFEAYEPNERCVWTIYDSSLASDRPVYNYRIDINKIGFSPNLGSSLVATCANSQRATMGNRKLIYQYPINETGQLITDRCDVLMITFQAASSNPASETGFVLEFIPREMLGGVSIVGPPKSRWSEQNLVSGNSGVFLHPQRGILYTDDEVSTFVYVPENNYNNPNTRLSLKFIEKGVTDDNCADNLEVLVFNRTSVLAHKWEPHSVICGGTPSGDIATGLDDMVMIIFRTNTYDTHYGFYLSHSYC